MAGKTAKKLPKGFSVAFSNDGTMLACGSQRIAVIDVKTRDHTRVFKPSKNPAHLAFSPDDSRLAVKDTSGLISVCDPKLGKVIHVLTHDHVLEGCRPAFTADGHHLLDGSWGGALTQWSLAGLHADLSAKFENGMILSLSFNVLQSLLLLCVQHRLAAGEVQPRPTELVLCNWPSLKLTRFDVGSELLNARLSQDGATMVALQRVERNWSAVFISVTQKAVISTVPIDKPGSLPDIAWSCNDRFVLLTCATGFLLIDALNFCAAGHFAADYPSSVAFHPDGERVALGTWEQTFLVSMRDILEGTNATAV
jgi:WD40 repeat protein